MRVRVNARGIPNVMSRSQPLQGQATPLLQIDNPRHPEVRTYVTCVKGGAIAPGIGHYLREPAVDG
jgi:hypothetical protein